MIRSVTSLTIHAQLHYIHAYDHDYSGSWPADT